MPQQISLQKQIDAINEKVAVKMTGLQQKQKTAVQMLNTINEKKEINKIKEKIKALK